MQDSTAMFCLVFRTFSCCLWIASPQKYAVENMFWDHWGIWKAGEWRETGRFTDVMVAFHSSL